MAISGDFIDLVDHQPVFDLILKVMDSNIHISRAQMIVIQQALRQAKFYEEQKRVFGDEEWSLLETVTGPLS